MATKIKDWLDDTVSRYQELSLSRLSNKEFFRDPPRPQFSDPNVFFSPADGVILYQEIVEDSGELLEVKGEKYTIEDLLQTKDVLDILPCMVVGVFMTFFSPHLNRVPYGGRLQYEFLEPISSRNLPMLLTENAIFKGKVDLTHMQYLKVNERVMNTIYSPLLDYEYHVLQIADKDVSVIQPFSVDQDEYYTQCERFSFVRWGSQCDLILPLDGRFEFHFVNEVSDVVEAGIDPLVRIDLQDHTLMIP